MSPLVQVIQSNKASSVAAALTGGADVNASMFGSTPLFHALMAAQPDVVDLLLAHGADWKKRDKGSGWTPLMMASINCHKSSRRYFSGRAIKDSRRIVASLIAAGAKDPETHFILGNDSDEAGLVSAVTRRKSKPSEEVLYLDGAVVLVPPRMKKQLDVGFPYLDTLQKFATDRRLTKLLKALAETAKQVGRT